MPLLESRVISFEIDETGKQIGTPSISEDGDRGPNGEGGGEQSHDETESHDHLKRMPDTPDGNSDQKRRRFIWPESLHKDFVAAIFDIGIRNASPDHIFELMCREDPRCAAFVNVNGILSHVQRCSNLRDRSNPHDWSYYEKSLLHGNEPQRLVKSRLGEDVNVEEDSSTSRNGNFGLEQKLFLLRKQLQLINDTIQIQSKFLASVKSSMDTQLKAQAKIIQNISSLDQSYAKQLQSNNQRQQKLLSSLPTYSESIVPSQGTNEATPRVELQIMSDMRTHMDLHRQLMLRKDTQVSQFQGKSNVSDEIQNDKDSVTQEWNWDEDHLDANLFSFLDEP